MAQPKKALVLSGGGGRGAYHIGVLEALVERSWKQDGQGPDIIAGTSIGAINAAALASGLTVADLKRRWLAMHTEEVHRLSTDLPTAARPLLRFMLRSVLTSEAHGGAQDTLPAEERAMSATGLLNRLDATAVTQRHAAFDRFPCLLGGCAGGIAYPRLIHSGFDELQGNSRDQYLCGRTFDPERAVCRRGWIGRCRAHAAQRLRLLAQSRGAGCRIAADHAPKRNRCRSNERYARAETR